MTMKNTPVQTPLGSIVVKATYGALLGFFLLFAPFLMAGESLLLRPWVNLRPSQAHAWLGLYLEERLYTRMRAGGLSLYSLDGGRVLPVDWEGLQIQGQYLAVAGQVFLHLKGPGGLQLKGRWNQTQLMNELDQWADQVGALVKADYRLEKKPFFPDLSDPLYVSLLRFQSKHAAKALRPVELLALYPLVQESREPVMAEKLARLMLLASPQRKQETKRYFRQIESLLQEALQQEPQQGNLYALLALTYHLMKAYPSWVEKTAGEATHYAPDNELGWILLAWAKGFSTGGGREALLRLEKQNPWLFSEAKAKKEYFQGLLLSELQQAALRLEEVKNPKLPIL